MPGEITRSTSSSTCNLNCSSDSKALQLQNKVEGNHIVKDNESAIQFGTPGKLDNMPVSLDSSNIESSDSVPMLDVQNESNLPKSDQLTDTSSAEGITRKKVPNSRPVQTKKIYVSLVDPRSGSMLVYCSVPPQKLTPKDLQILRQAKEEFKTEAARGILDQIIEVYETPEKLEPILESIRVLNSQGEIMFDASPGSEGMKLLSWLNKAHVTYASAYAPPDTQKQPHTSENGKPFLKNIKQDSYTGRHFVDYHRSLFRADKRLGAEKIEQYVREDLEKNRWERLQVLIVDGLLDGSYSIDDSKNLFTCIVEKIAVFGEGWVNLGSFILKQAAESIQKNPEKNKSLLFKLFGCQETESKNEKQEKIFENIQELYRTTNHFDQNAKSFMDDFFKERQLLQQSTDILQKRIDEDKQILAQWKKCLSLLRKKTIPQRQEFLSTHKDLGEPEGYYVTPEKRYKLLRIGKAMMELLMKASFLDEESLKCLGDMLPDYIWCIPDKNHRGVVQQAILKDNQTFLEYAIEKRKDKMDADRKVLWKRNKESGKLEDVRYISNEELAAKRLKFKSLSQLLKVMRESFESTKQERYQSTAQKEDRRNYRYHLDFVNKILKSWRLCLLALITLKLPSRLKLIKEVDILRSDLKPESDDR